MMLASAASASRRRRMEGPAARHPEPVLEGSGVEGSWDAAEVGAPYAVSMAAGRWRLYYAGKAEGASAWQGIGVALSDGDSLAMPTSFSRRATE